MGFNRIARGRTGCNAELEKSMGEVKQHDVMLPIHPAVAMHDANSPSHRPFQGVDSSRVDRAEIVAVRVTVVVAELHRRNGGTMPHRSRGVRALLNPLRVDDEARFTFLN